MNKRIGILVPVALFLVGLGIVFGYFLFHGTSPAKGINATSDDRHEEKSAEAAGSGEKIVRLTDEQIAQWGIGVDKASAGILPQTVSLNGEVAMNADRIAQIVPRISGTVTELRKNIGDHVRKGEVVAVLDSRELADLHADWQAARQRLALADDNFRREEQLWNKRISAQQDFLEAGNARTTAQIAWQTACQKLNALGFSEAQLNQLANKSDETSLTRFEVTAPFDATIIEKNTNLGAVLKDDSSVFRIADLRAVWINLDVQPKDLSRIRPGQTVILDDGPGIPETQGTIQYIEPTVVEASRTVHARVVIPNREGRWRPGMFVVGHVWMDPMRVPICIPVDAVTLVDGQNSVFVRTGDGTGFVARPVRMGRKTMKEVEITSGLRSGETFVSRNVFAIKAERDKPEGE